MFSNTSAKPSTMSEQYQHPQGREGSLSSDSSETSRAQRTLGYNHAMQAEAYFPTPESLTRRHYPHRPPHPAYSTLQQEKPDGIQRPVPSMGDNVKTTAYSSPSSPSSPSDDTFTRAKQKLANTLVLPTERYAVAGSLMTGYPTPESSSNILDQIEHPEVSKGLFQTLPGSSMSGNTVIAFPRSTYVLKPPRGIVQITNKKEDQGLLHNYQEQPGSTIPSPLMQVITDHGTGDLETLGMARGVGLSGSQNPNQFTFDLSDPFITTQTGLHLGGGLDDAEFCLSLGSLDLTTGSEPLESNTNHNAYFGPIARPKYDDAHTSPGPETQTKRNQSKYPFESASESASESSRKTTIMDLETSQNNSIVSQVVGASADTIQVEHQEDQALDLIGSIPSHVQQVAAAVQEIVSHVKEEFGPGVSQPFRPSYKLLREAGLLPNLETYRSIIAHRYNSSSNYQGDATISYNRSAEVPASENCALWILGLPAHVTYTALLKSIRGIGSVFATVINPPTGKHRTSAAKLVFFERYQAEKLMLKVLNNDFKVMGQTIRSMRWNHIKSARHPYPEQSRAIRITGSKELMSFDFFETFFRSRFTYELDWRGEVACQIPGMVSHEWHFGSLRCQASSAKAAIERELRGPYMVQWVLDPCAKS